MNCVAFSNALQVNFTLLRTKQPSRTCRTYASLAPVNPSKSKIQQQEQPLNTAKPAAAQDGSLSTSSFNWIEQWYPLAFIADLPKHRPSAHTLLDVNLVVWWASRSKSDPRIGSWVVSRDRCPHRLAALSEGVSHFLHLLPPSYPSALLLRPS